MARGTYPRRLKVSRPAAEVLARYLLHWNSRDLYREPERFPTIQSTSLFGNNQPLSLEIGCGTGEFLCELADHYPEYNFLGVDIALKPLYRAIETARTQSLENVRFLKANIKMIYPLLGTDTLQSIFLHFPVPGRRPRAWRHNIFEPQFLDYVHSTLVPGGYLSVMTDNTALFDEMLAIARDDGRFRLVENVPYHFVMKDAMKSHNQRIWEGRGQLTRRFELVPLK